MQTNIILPKDVCYYNRRHSYFHHVFWGGGIVDSYRYIEKITCN
jgi:hypothetical protein